MTESQNLATLSDDRSPPKWSPWHLNMSAFNPLSCNQVCQRLLFVGSKQAASGLARKYRTTKGENASPLLERKSNGWSLIIDQGSLIIDQCSTFVLHQRSGLPCFGFWILRSEAEWTRDEKVSHRCQGPSILFLIVHKTTFSRFSLSS